ncbi:MAG: 3-oxoadipate enol-lactonase [Gemmatimonadetes bacterium]|nr:3-oxoadipate enol-lactonase [Gemmatimonadota bacterium]
MADRARIAWRSDGPPGRPVVVFSNSLGSTWLLWDEVVERLAGRYRVIRYDQRGHGGSTAPGEAWSIATLGADVVSVLDQAGVARAHFCGISLGGLTGQWLARHAPERLDRLVLANTGAKIGEAAFWDARIATVRSEGMGAVVDGLLSRWFTERFRAANPKLIARYGAMLIGCDPVGYAACCAAVRDADFRDQLAMIAAPTLVIAGSEDVATPPELGRALAAGIPSAAMVTLPAAHLSCVEQAPAFADALVDFFSRT